ncbi:MAG: hypothetical protein ACRETM_14060 [Stenotrophobium sp.]
MELEITWGRAIRIWWSYFWRNLIAILAAVIVGGVIGGILGAIMGTAGASMKTIQMVSMPIGLILGLGISVIPMKMILGKDFGEFRLALVQKQQ